MLHSSNADSFEILICTNHDDAGQWFDRYPHFRGRVLVLPAVSERSASVLHGRSVTAVYLTPLAELHPNSSVILLEAVRRIRATGKVFEPVPVVVG